ncbi:MAG: hypothetical protein ACREDI_00840 [Roseiarcus sp.]
MFPRSSPRRCWSDFRGKVVVLNFVYTNCADERPLHAERIARIQSMVNLTPMKSSAHDKCDSPDPGKR